MPDVVQEDVKLFRREVGQPDHRSGEVAQAVRGKAILGKAGGQRLIAEQAPAAVLEKGIGAAEEEADGSRHCPADSR